MASNPISIPAFNIKPLCNEDKTAIQQRIDGKTKPPGALGALEKLATKLALIQGNHGNEELALVSPTMVVFAGDHGVANEGISIAPSAVTRQMVLNFLQGGAAINCFCRVSGMAFSVVDAGIIEPIDHPDLIQQRLGEGTQNFVAAPAMSVQCALEGIQSGGKLVRELAAKGCNVIGFGEMGIGNTSSASALMASLLGVPADECVGRGTGISDEQLTRKIALISQALLHHQDQIDSPLEGLACLGGFEIVQMVGAMLAAAESKMIILVDGFIATAAALYAHALNPLALEYMVFCHRSEEQAHARMLSFLGAEPLLDLNLRLGEGTGAALAYPLLKAAVEFYNHMASFEQAGVEAV